MKITALLALALAAVVAASPVAEPELVEQRFQVPARATVPLWRRAPAPALALRALVAILPATVPNDISAILRAPGSPGRLPFLPYVAQKPHYPRANTIHQGKLSPVHDDTTMAKSYTSILCTSHGGTDSAAPPPYHNLYSNGYGIYESRLRKFIKPSLTSPAVNLLHVMLLAAGDHPALLGLVKDGLARLLHERGITAMFVEMVIIDPCFQPSLFPMSPDHGLVVNFEEGMQRIIGLIQATSGNNWRLLYPFNVGRVETEARPAIVILADYLTPANCFRPSRWISSPETSGSLTGRPLRIYELGP
ncbi:hypothetical protein CNMCM8980_002922 [Aspergillus fumigatiaffinis]|uniref:Uncharacterized protein n=1 Tax=Aspergillus fumigatiaffinis TaxID=340414 RepID=A0A8H4GPQ9_9EURO|nr:hypothetical protein CNMCM5878_003248 [Aspergillus fumigatiaffinis]KAF4225848.1 hypothetical protein CNMCM6457_007706 [Aspergillus fumigatiaffinis]KAF4236496.1 hypothetical protein CNMCM8980_002922 [Aspergillus fumigatiaffinis]KAF4239254.1 hypothetical protein CNMCM6805_005913 [Aspergillus fumigatiaffinis]